MSIEQVRRFVLFVVLLLVQGLVLNHIHLFDCATPLIYIILVLHFRRNQSRWSALLWSFSLGLCVDVFANTPGVAAASGDLQFLQLDPVAQVYRGQYPAHLLAGYGIGKY